MKPFESSDNEWEIITGDDIVKFEDLDVIDMQCARRWQWYLQCLFTRKLRRCWFIGGIVANLICLTLVLAPLLLSLYASHVPKKSASLQARAGSHNSYLEAVTLQFVYEVQSEPGIIRALRRSDGTQVWSYRSPVPINNPLTISNNVLYIHVSKNRIYALHALTGKLLWKYALPSAFRSFSLAIMAINGVVYESSLQGDVIALQGKTGKVLWTYRQKEQVVLNDVQFNVADGVAYLSFLQEQQTLVLDALNGSLLWRVNSPSNFIAASSGISYLVERSDNFYAFQSRTGTLLWESPFALSLDHYVVMPGGVIALIAPDGSVEELRIEDGSTIWKSSVTGSAADMLRLIGGRLYIISGDASKRGVLMALDPATGKLLWRYSGPRLTYIEGAGNHVYIIGIDHRLHALQAGKGKILWSFPLRQSQLSDNDISIDMAGESVLFQIANNTIFITMIDEHNMLTVLNGNNGHVRWRKNIFGTPLLLAGKAYITGTDGALHAYLGSSGKEIWSTQ